LKDKKKVDLVLKALRDKQRPIRKKKYMKKIDSNSVPYISKSKTSSTPNLLHTLTRNWSKGKARVMNKLGTKVIDYVNE